MPFRRLLCKDKIIFRVSRLWLTVGIAAVAAAIFFGAGTYLRVWERTRERDLSLTIPVQAGDDRQNTLFFPIGSAPRLRSVTIRNVGSIPVGYPRLVINEENQFGSMQEIVQSCRNKYQDPVAVDVCMAEILYLNLQHVGNDVVGGHDENFPAGVLEALNYYGYSQCYPTAEFLAQLVRVAGEEACLLDFSEHVVTEIRARGRRYLLDPDRNIFYTPDRYDALVSYDEIAAGDALNNTVGHDNPAMLFNHKMAESFSMANVLANRDVFKDNAPTVDCQPRPIPEFPLEKFQLLPGDSLTFDRACDEPANGCVVTLERTIEGKGEISIDLPFPALMAQITPIDEGQVVRGSIRDPVEQVFTSNGSAVIIDLAREKRAYSRIFNLAIDLETIPPVKLSVHMRYAEKAIPELKEGVNTLRFVRDAAEGPAAGLLIIMCGTVRVMEH